MLLSLSHSYRMASAGTGELGRGALWACWLVGRGLGLVNLVSYLLGSVAGCCTKSVVST
ncbi:Uncharacterised protein [Mycobacteroides abscessus subsp. abscessus]|nr:Uncharacterised protein [Mycobacteroides abscessus subsp. abscessus]